MLVAFYEIQHRPFNHELFSLRPFHLGAFTCQMRYAVTSQTFLLNTRLKVVRKIFNTNGLTCKHNSAQFHLNIILIFFFLICRSFDSFPEVLSTDKCFMSGF